MNMRRALVGVVAALALSATLGVTATAAGGPVLASASAHGPGWSTAWAASPSAGTRTASIGHTVRNVVHTTIGGPRARVRLSNRFGSEPVRFGHVTVALSARTGVRRDGTGEPSDGTAVPGSMRDVAFGERSEVVVPAGAEVLSDPVDLAVPPDADLLVSVWTPARPALATWHAGTKQRSFTAFGPADRAASPDGFRHGVWAWFYVTAVEVTGAPGTVVAFGDSITNGAASTPGRNRRWPDLLAARLAASPVADLGVANAGVSGNRILLDARHPRYRNTAVAGRSGLSRFAADALDRAGVRTVIVLAGVNDIIQTPRQTDPARVIEGLNRLVHLGQARGVRVLVCTIPPFRGWSGHTAAAERVRGQVNAWIRTREAFADFDLALRDPADPRRLRPDLDGGDHLHPNDAGMLALAAAVPLELL